MKKKKSGKYMPSLIILLVALMMIIIFKNQIYSFLVRFNKIESILQDFNIDEYIQINISNNDMQFLQYTNRVDDKNLFDLFHFAKKTKPRKIDYSSYILIDKNIKNINKTDSISNIITYEYSNDKKSSIQINSIILAPGESITCECLDLLLNKTLVFDNKGVTANKLDTPNSLYVTYENKKFDNFEIKNNQITKIKIPSNREGKSITINWNKNPSGILIFKGIDKNEFSSSNNKSIFITLKSKNLSQDFFKKLKNKYNSNELYINQNSYPLSSNYIRNIKSLESFTTPMNFGYTYRSQDIFKEKEKNFFNLVNSNFKDLLRINVYHKNTNDSPIEYATTLIKIERENSISNIDTIISDSIRNSTADIIRVDINPSTDNNEDILLNILNKIDSNYNIFIITGDDYDFNKKTLISNQDLILILPNKNQIELLNSIKKIYENSPIQQSLLIEILSKLIKNKDNIENNISKPNTILVQSDNEEAFIFNNESYFTNKKFLIPFNKIKLYQTIIEEQRSKYQIRDILFSMTNMRNAKVKLFSKDRILRCFSNKNIKLGQFFYDSKQEYYNVELKMQSEDVIDEWQVSCLLNGDNFYNDYKIEAQKDGKQISQLQVGIGEYMIHPSANLITNNTLNITNINDFSLLYSIKSPRKSYANLSEDLVLWSHYYPSIPQNLNYTITYKEKK